MAMLKEIFDGICALSPRISHYIVLEVQGKGNTPYPETNGYGHLILRPGMRLAPLGGYTLEQLERDVSLNNKLVVVEGTTCYGTARAEALEQKVDYHILKTQNATYAVYWADPPKPNLVVDLFNKVKWGLRN